jgi:hypothetical protein
MALDPQTATLEEADTAAIADMGNGLSRDEGRARRSRDRPRAGSQDSERRAAQPCADSEARERVSVVLVPAVVAIAVITFIVWAAVGLSVRARAGTSHQVRTVDRLRIAHRQRRVGEGRGSAA